MHMQRLNFQKSAENVELVCQPLNEVGRIESGREAGQKVIRSIAVETFIQQRSSSFWEI